MGKILGLDLGITSVGYGIIDEETNEIIDYGVRLFEEGTAENNLKRRTVRSSRRLKSRRRNRINAIVNLLKNEGIINDDFVTYNNVYELRFKGLTQKLSNNELASVLINLAKRRGSSLEVVVDEESKDDALLASALTNNTKELKDKNYYVCQLQLERLNNKESIRDHSNQFRMEDYKKELIQILSNQGLTKEINDKIVNIITRRREFSEGPGSEKFPTPYGSYREEYVDGNLVIKHVNLIEEMRGKCSIFKNEPRIAKNTYTACLFNLLNDLNDLKYLDNKKLTIDQKNELIEKYINKTGKLSISSLCKYLGCKEEDLSGLRKDKNGKFLLSTFDGYVKLLKILPDDILQDKDKCDEIIEILTKTLVVTQRTVELKNILTLEDELIENLANLTKINGYHALSKKAMNEIIPEMLETNKNQMQIITNNNLRKDAKKLIGKNIPFDEDAILSPVAKRVHIQALKLTNELRKEYGEFSSIVIETTRSKNSQEQKKEIEKYQARREANKKRSEELLLELDKNPDKFNSLTKLKVALYKVQDGKTMYAGLPIDLETLLNDPTAYQIEHIIPYAVSFDNSLDNKALASEKENNEKGKMSPWGYFSSGKAFGPHDTWDKYVAFVNTLRISKRKRENLLNQDDISKYKNMESFLARNLVDTSYGIRTVMNSMKNYFKANDIDTKVFTIKGKITGEFRGRVGLEKNRDIYIHHAIDALIIAFAKNQKAFRNAFKLQYNGELYIEQTGEVIDIVDNPFDDDKILKYIAQLKNIKGEASDFSYKVDKKTNRQFSDETIYSTRIYDGMEYVIKKFKNIYGDDGKSLKKVFADGKANSKLLLAKNDPKTFEILQKVYESYINESNPFAKYNEEFGPIRKYSKDGNGPIIKKIKYIDSKLGNHLDISSKYNVKNKKVILLQNTPYRTDIYCSPDGLYKFLTVRRYHIKQVNGYNVIDEDIYNSLKKDKNIQNADEFKFSLNRNDIIDIISAKDLLEGENPSDKHRYLRFIATSNDLQNVIEYKSIDSKDEKRCMYSIGKSVFKFDKYNVSITGKWSKVIKEDLKLRWK